MGRWNSRVKGLPEVMGEFPVATLAEEIETPGEGQFRALVTIAGNPVVSSPNAKRLDRALASLELTAQGRRLIEDGQPDQAIAVLERAVSLHAGNGQNYYYLAQAWLIKKNRAQARACNRLAALYLKDDGRWSWRVQQQAAQIDRLQP